MTRKDTILLEDINDKLDAILEGQTAMAPIIAQIKDMDQRVTHHDDWIKSGIAAMKDISKQLRNHETRITRLEQAT